LLPPSLACPPHESRSVGCTPFVPSGPYTGMPSSMYPRIGLCAVLVPPALVKVHDGFMW
jgi:hypothetical protein